MELEIYEAGFLLRDPAGRSVVIPRSGTASLGPRLERSVIQALLGTYLCNGEPFLVVCAEAEPMSTVAGVFRALRCFLLPFSAPSSPESSKRHISASIEKLLSSGTFFFAAARNDQARTRLLHRAACVVPAESEFLWNRYLSANMSPEGQEWVSPLMQGFVGGVQRGSLVLTVISRRSVKQAGTRFNARGIDDEGSVAIFTETEVIVEQANTVVLSFVQVRGSVPVFWSQTSAVELCRNFEMTKSAFRKHVCALTNEYGNPLIFVNLLSTSKSGETTLSQSMARHLADLDPSPTSPVLVDFDFHKFVNQSRLLEDSLTPLMDTLRPFVHLVGYSGPAGRQRGVFRVNCLDCLDRTNVVQMMIAWEALGRWSSEQTMGLKEDFFDLWVRNGDAISKGYSGVGSVLSRLVKTAGKPGSGAQLATLLEHSWRSANRFIVSNWEDAERHNAIVSLVGSPSTEQPLEPIFGRDLTLWVGSWNLHGKRLDETRGGLGGWINDAADIVIFNFQEVIDLSASSVFFQSRGDDVRNRTIDVEVLKHLSFLGSNAEYVQVASESMVGLYMTVFVKRKYSDFVDHVKTNRLKAGFGGATGNKGSISIFFRIFKTIEIDAINLHLDSGEYRGEERMNQLAFLLEAVPPRRASPDGKTRSVFIAGDFNFRCDGIDPIQAIELIRKSKLEKLRKFDPYIAAPSNVLKRCGFRELPLLFPPTYKYDHSGRLTDKRTPSWCDRIFFRSSGPAELATKEYNSVQAMRFSDHKPVFATFTLMSQNETSETEITHHHRLSIDAGLPVIISPSRASTTPPIASPTTPPGVVSPRKPATLVDLLSGEDGWELPPKPKRKIKDDTMEEIDLGEPRNANSIPDLLL